jgi:hypothetical protein
MKFFNKLTFPLLFLLASCSSPLKPGPMIYFSNSSPKPIKNIKCAWTKNHTLSLHQLLPGESRSMSFFIEKPSEFFGKVNVTWSNNDGEYMNREFYFREKHMPGINDKDEFNYVQIYLDQQDMELLSSDAADLTGRTQRMDALLAQYHHEYYNKNPNADMSLIKVDPKKDNSLPGWLATAQ